MSLYMPVLMCGMSWILCTLVSPNSWDHSDGLASARKLHVVTCNFFRDLSITVFHCVCEMYLDELFPSQVDPEIVLCKLRVVKYRLLKKSNANDRPNYTLKLRIIHVQK